MSTNMWKHISLVILSASYFACQEDVELERRPFNRDSQTESPTNPAAGDTANQTIDIDSDFNPDDPNLVPGSTTASFPNLTFNLTGVPTEASDYHQFEIPVEADPVFSHYAYKIDNLDSCEESGGYTVHEISRPLRISVPDLPDGMVYLCVISFHFPTKKWQSLANAHVYNWEKVRFERVISSFYEYDSPVCNRRIRVQADLNITGTTGTYSWLQERVPGCPADTNPTIDQMSQIKTENDVITGVWHEGTMVAGWFEFKFTNAERTQFTGIWGFGQPGSKTEGPWNSNP